MAKSMKYGKHEGPKSGGKSDVGYHSHTSKDSKGGHIPHAGHGLHPDHPMLHSDEFHKNEHHG